MARFVVTFYSLAVVVSSLALTACAQNEQEESSRLEERDLKSAYQTYKAAGSKCVDSSWLHNLQNNIVEVPSRFQRIRGCRKSDSFIMNLAGNKSYKYGYNLNNEVDTRVLASYQSKPSKRISQISKKKSNQVEKIASFLLLLQFFLLFLSQDALFRLYQRAHCPASFAQQGNRTAHGFLWQIFFSVME